MPVVRFLRNFDWKPVPAQTIAYKAGAKHLVTTRCAERAIAKGAAEKVERAAFKKVEEPIKRRRRKGSDGEDTNIG